MWDENLFSNEFSSNHQTDLSLINENITKQLQKKGYKIGIVNADNVFFSIEDWKKSNTYCLNKQDKLVFKDNRTDEFERSSPEMKKKMSKFCWGM